MAAHELTDEDCMEALRMVSEAGAVATAARIHGIPRNTLAHRVKTAAQRGLKYTADAKPEGFVVPAMPDDDLSGRQIAEFQAARFEKRRARKLASKWMQIKVRTPGPIGLMWLGDPHVDDNGCDWPTLLRHLDIIKSSPAIKGCSLGDMQNAWVGGLQRLWASQDTSAETAHKLVTWLVGEMDPLILIRGNHDAWLGSGDPLLYVTEPAVVENWRADIEMVFRNGRTCRIVAAHDLPGFSMWNELHGQLRAAKMGVKADVYLSGHRHTWGLAQMELADRDDRQCVWIGRARGYKFHDSHAQRHGYPEQQHGQAILQVIDPDAGPVGFVQCFADVEEGADYLAWKRVKGGYDKASAA